jgi:O-antigen/teichoic acid export membrane protein
MNDPLGTPTEYANFSLRLSFLLSSLGVVAIVAFALSYPLNHEQQFSTVLVLAGIVPFVMMREFARRYAFAHLRTLQALYLDISVAMLTVLGLGLLGWTAKMSTTSAFAVIGISCGFAALTWRYILRQEFTPVLGQYGEKLTTTWNLGKWFLAGQLAIQAQGYVVYWLSLAVAGTSVTGIYAACMSIVALANPVLYGFFNLLLPKFVGVLKAEGGRGLFRQALLDALVLFVLMLIFCTIIGFFGEIIMGLLYPNGEYAANSNILSILALASMAAAIGVPASLALASAERGRIVAIVTFGTVVLNVVLVWVLMAKYGLWGAALGTLLAESIGSAGRWLSLVATVPHLDRAHDEI